MKLPSPLLLLLLAMLICPPTLSAGESSHPNVLFINIDDMNDWTEMMGRNPQIQTPQMHRLANMGTYFTNAHCQYPRCVQSRSSYITGLYPETFFAKNVEGAADGHEIKDSQGVVEQAELLGTQVIDEYFRSRGYKTYMVGKIYHGQAHANVDVDGGYGGGSAGKPANAVDFPGEGTGTDWGIYEAGEATDAEMGDYQNASWVIDQLENHPADGQPFFMAIGFKLPHVPWYIPQNWADLYPADETLWLEPFNPELWEVDEETGRFGPSPLNTMPSAAASKLLQGYPNILDPDDEQYVGLQGWRDITQVYAGSISFVDDQIGRILDGLANSPHASNTVIVLFSDHGYHLGNKNSFTKHNLWDRANRVPLFFAGPGVPAGQTLDRTVELVDVYPTLLALTGLPPNPANEGDNLVPLMQNPGIEWNEPALIFHGSNADQAVVKENWRYITYDPTDPDDAELYDVAADPYESNNLAQQPAYQDKIDEMRTFLMPRPFLEVRLVTVGEGTITRNPPGPYYEKGAEVEVSAVPAQGWQFDQWGRHASGSEPTTTVTVHPWNRTVKATFSLGTASYETWDAFTPAEHADASISGKLEDPDNDRYRNIFEYLFRTNPKEPDQPQVPRSLLNPEGQFQFRVRSDDPNLIFRPELSLDLQTWHYNGDGSGQDWLEIVNQIWHPEDNSRTYLVEPLTDGEPASFFRLHVNVTVP